MSNDTTKSHHVLVLGSSFAALKTAHKIFSSRSSQFPIKITMLSTSTHFWWSVGAPRAMFTPYPKSLSDSFIDVTTGFQKYIAEGVYEFIHGRAIEVDTSARRVAYQPMTNNTSAAPAPATTISYDSLVVATGSQSSSPLFSLQSAGHVPTEAAMRDIHQQLGDVKSIIIVGGGTAGVETAGVLGQLNQQNGWNKSVTLLSGGHALLPALQRADISAYAQRTLETFGVQVEHGGLRVDHSEKLTDGSTELRLSDGSKRRCDMFIVATGRKPVSDFMNAKLVDEKGSIVVDKYHRVKGTQRVWAIGDCQSLSNLGLAAVQFGVPAVAHNVLAEIKAIGEKQQLLDASLKEYSPPIDPNRSQFVPIGHGGGVGMVAGWWIPSFFVWLIKARDFMFGRMSGYVDGTA